MRTLPEGAGSPISQMPQKTKGGLQPTHHAHFPKPQIGRNYLKKRREHKLILGTRINPDKKGSPEPIEGGFQYVIELAGMKFFKKCK
jgi:hypothetical protein